MGICCVTQGAQPSALVQARGLGDGREVEREGICVLLWLIRVDVAEATQYCKAIIFQLKLLKKDKFRYDCNSVLHFSPDRAKI